MYKFGIFYYLLSLIFIQKIQNQQYEKNVFVFKTKSQWVMEYVDVFLTEW